MERVPSTDGVTVAVHDLGGEGPDLLLCHPTGFAGLIWRPVATRLPDFHCIAPDLRGHGDSPTPDDHDFDWHGFADDVLAIVDALALDGCVAAGHSKGGAALLLAEQRRPGTFRALWCYEPVVFPGPPLVAVSGNPMAAGARRRRSSFPSRAAAFENFHSKPPLDIFTDEALDAYLDGGFREEPDGSLTLKCEPEHEARVFEMGAQHSAFQALERVQCPVRVVRGAVSPGPAQFADAIVAELPNATLEVHEHLGHFGPQQAPDEIAASIRRTLQHR
jgi:pimeloyl-ACP methyl ester carboxylesterase